VTFAIARQVRKARATDAFGPPKHLRDAALKGPRAPAYVAVPQHVWVEHATREAILANVKPSLVMGTSHRKEVWKARWKAWRAILDSPVNYSVNSLAAVSGYNHVSILYAMRTMKQREAQAKMVVPGRHSGKLISLA